MSEHARVVSVEDKNAGDELVVDAIIGATSITVEDLVDFDENGGWLVINDQVIRYTDADDETGVLNLATGLTAAAVIGDRVDVWDTTTASPSVDRVAWVAFDGMDDGDALDYVVRHDLIDYLPVEDPSAARANGLGESVEINDNDLVSNIIGKTPIIDLSHSNPDTMPEGGPVELPAVSPTPESKVGPAAAIITWSATVGLRYEVHVSITNTAAPDPSTLHSEVAGPDVWIYKLPDGTTLLPTDQDVYVALVAYNSAGETAPASPWVTARAGAIPPEFIQVLAGEIIAQAMNTDSFRANTIHGVSLDVAGILLNAIDGLFVPGVNGTTRLSAPLDPAQPIQILAFIEALGAIFRDNITIRGLNNFLHGLLKLGNGVSDPSTPPTISSAWDHTETHLTDLSETFGNGLFHGMTDNVAGTDWVSMEDFFVSKIRLVNKTTGADGGAFATDSDFRPAGGITRIGSSYYVLGRDQDRADDWYVYRYNSSFVKNGEARLFPASDLNRWPAIGNDGTNVLIAYTRINTTLRLRTYPVSEFTTTPNSSTATASSIDDLPVTGSPYNITSVFKGSFFGVSNHLIITGLSGPMWVFNAALARVTSLEPPRAGGTKIQGLHRDGTRFRHLDDSGRVWDYSLHDGSSKPYTYTWYDGDAGGSGTAESKPSPAAVFTVPRGARPVISTPAPDDDGTADAPDRVMVYAQNVRQATYNVGELSRSFDSLAPSGTAAPTTSGFASRPASAPGSVASTESDGEGSLAEVNGDGSWRLGVLRNSGTDAVIGAAGSAISVARRGTVTANTDASGQVTVTHSMGTTPAQVHIQKVGGGSRTAELQSKGSTTFVVQSRDEGGAATATGTSITFDWFALA